MSRLSSETWYETPETLKPNDPIMWDQGKNQQKMYRGSNFIKKKSQQHNMHCK